MAFSRVNKIVCRILAASMIVAGASAMTGCKKKTPEEKFEEAQMLLAEGGQMPVAMFKMKDIIEQHPDSEVVPNVHLVLAQGYLSQGTEDGFNKAMKEYQAVYDKLGVKDERGLNAHGTMTMLYMQKGDIEKAIELSEQGIKAAEGDEALVTEMKLIHARLQLQAESEETQQTGIAYLQEQMLNSDQPLERNTAREFLANYYRSSGDFAKSNEVYGSYLEKYPDSEEAPELRMAMGMNYKMLNQPVEAEETYVQGEDAFKKRIEDELVQDEKNKMMMKLVAYQKAYGNAEAAEATMRQIMKENQGTQLALETQFQIAEMYGDMGDWDKAGEILNQIKLDNAGTQIEQMADQALANLEMIKKRIAEMQAEAEKAMDEAANAPAPDATPEATPEAAEEPAPEATPENQ